MELEENKAVAVDINVAVAADIDVDVVSNDETDTNTNSDTHKNTDKTPWGLIAVVGINLCIVIFRVSSSLFNIYALKHGKLDMLIGEKMVLNSLIITACIVITLSIASVGLMLNKAWGWWVNEGFYFYGVVKAVLTYIALVNAASSPELAHTVTQSVKTYSMVRTGLEMFFSLLMFAYLFRKKIRSFLSINKGPIKTLFIFLGISIVIFIASTIIYNVTIFKGNY